MFFTKKEDKGIDFPIVHFVDNIVFSKTHVWAYYELGVVLQDFFGNDTKVSIANEISGVFRAIAADKTNPVDCHIVSTVSPVNVDSWENQMLASSATWNRKIGFYDYIDKMGEFIRSKNFVERKCYLGVCLGKRGDIDVSNINVLQEGIKETVNVVSKMVKNFMLVPDTVPSVDEEALYVSREKDVYNNVSSSVLVGKRCSSQDLLLLIKKQFYPVMPAPYLEINHSSRMGVNDIISETNGVIKNHFRHLEITQDIDGYLFTGYRCCMTFTRFAKETVFPFTSLPFLYFPAMKGLPFTVWARFSIIPTRKMRKAIDKKKVAAKNEIENFSSVANSTDIAINNAGGLTQNLTELREIDDLVQNNTNPWIKGSYYIVVEANSEEGVKFYTDYLRKEFSNSDIDLSLTVGDQYDLFMEQLVGANPNRKAVSHTTSLSLLSTSGFNYASRVGDKIKQ